MLKFCRSAGGTVFTVNYLYVKGEESEQRSSEFYQRLSVFSGGERLLENICGNGFQPQQCWLLDDESIEAILKDTNGDLFAYDVLNLPEDWLFYVGDSILLQIVTHEQEATLRLTDDQYAQFSKLAISHKRGNPKWSGLPEEPTRTTPAR